MIILLTMAAVALLLFISEVWWRKHPKPGELNRKFVHISVGTFVAFWPFFLSWTQISVMSVAFLIGIGLSKYFHIFRAIHSVQRVTYGELLFAVSVGAVAMATNSKGIYAAALLHMSLADGFAAIIGQQFSTAKTRYKVFGATKSVIGTVTFFVISVGLLTGYAMWTGNALPVVAILGLAATTSLIENAGVYGLDNLFVPLLIAVALKTL